MSQRKDRLILPGSIIDTDLYKFTMQQAVLRYFPEVQATYRFTHRDKDIYFSRECYELFVESVKHFDELGLTDPEHVWLAKACPYFSAEYLNYLAKFRFKPEQVKVTFHPKDPSAPVSRYQPPPHEDGTRGRDELGKIEIEATGPWHETILWEVPLMACLSELFFTTVDTDWSYDGQEENAYGKACTYLEHGCTFSEFGTRRRRSYYIQDLVVQTLIRAYNDYQKDETAQKVGGNGGELMGTSNVHLAYKHSIMPIGTIAHEWFMAVGALRGYEHANALGLKLWEDVYHDALLLALTDTFSTEAFFRDFTKERAERWAGLRQDSGNPFVYAPRAKEKYEALGVEYKDKKTIIYSDSVDVEKALKLQTQTREIGFLASFGIGTSLTNDFRSVSSGGKEKSKALNMVIKLGSVGGQPCVKISDELSKNTGDPAAVRLVKETFNINA
ncbi:uncharacterized protein PHACADRAFT_100657 [Phanerochaete carnosa HHB-10118-sp]|uniref:Nicotinate phosphoribosyltransferase n=1 Tax=Phanerochaete carnosa (strain HHB-10118-sp) TaxID=650164 RepID=K5W1B9_PHACS|nr:uncharacterized protein PHACADRAFT_100657 [Phanerochaete carnosa HHB-10118-sp]EKM52890.1 hypothetical protein PHACADRAFT_100657 [Phanerochaete carnosa HHB-10118-sp]